MESEIIKLATTQGLWAVLFVSLLFYVLKNNEKREERLMSCLDNLSQQYETLTKDINDVKDDVGDIKNDIQNLSHNRKGVGI
jgi:seryl-tRNA synthetase